MRPTLKQRILSGAVILVVMLSTAELTVRLFGYQSWSPKKDEKEGLKRDAELGWLERFPSQKIKADLSENQGEVWILGGSFSAGFGLDSTERFSTLLDDKFKDIRVLNYAVSGYSSYQSFLLARRLLQEKAKPIAIIYGFVDFHEYRNIAHWQWLKGLAWNTSTGTVSIPYCRLSKSDKLICYPGRAYPKFPGRNYFALPPFLEELYLRLGDLKVLQQKGPVTVKIVSRFNDLCRKRGIKFSVVYLFAVNQSVEPYSQKFSNSSLHYINCVHPQGKDRKFIQPSNAHPNALLHAHWSRCLEPFFGTLSGKK